MRRQGECDRSWWDDKASVIAQQGRRDRSIQHDAFKYWTYYQLIPNIIYALRLVVHSIRYQWPALPIARIVHPPAVRTSHDPRWTCGWYPSLLAGTSRHRYGRKVPGCSSFYIVNMFFTTASRTYWAWWRLAIIDQRIGVLADGASRAHWTLRGGTAKRRTRAVATSRRDAEVFNQTMHASRTRRRNTVMRSRQHLSLWSHLACLCDNTDRSRLSSGLTRGLGWIVEVLGSYNRCCKKHAVASACHA